LIFIPSASLSAGVPVSLLRAKAPAGSPLTRTPAGVFAPGTKINRVFYQSTLIKIQIIEISGGKMFKPKESSQSEYEFVCIDELYLMTILFV
jgi:hypothetical protein